MRIVLCYVTKPCHLEQIAAVMPEAEIVDASQEQIARKSSPPTSSAATPRCRSIGTASSARGGCNGSNRRPRAWTTAWFRR